MRLIDNPGVQRCTTCSVDTVVLVRILDLAALEACSSGWTEGCEQLILWAAEVQSGERVTLRVEDWPGMTSLAIPLAMKIDPKMPPGVIELRDGGTAVARIEGVGNPHEVAPPS